MFANRQKKGCTRRWCTPFFESYVAIFQYSRFFRICQLFQFCVWVLALVFGVEWHLGKPSCGWFGRYASLSACVLFASGCVFRICYESFLDSSFSEFFMLLKWRTAFSYISLSFQYHLINTSVKGDSLSPLTIPLRRAEPARPQFRLRRFLLALLIVDTAADKFSYQCSFWNPVQRKWHLLFQNCF